VDQAQDSVSCTRKLSARLKSLRARLLITPGRQEFTQAIPIFHRTRHFFAKKRQKISRPAQKIRHDDREKNRARQNSSRTCNKFCPINPDI
jgi:hypothetical protein